MVIAFSAVALDAWNLEGDVVLTDDQVSWFASVVQLVSIPGSLLGGGLLQLLGPRRLLLCLLPGLTLSWPVFLLSKHHPPTLIFLRALQGLLTSGASICIYVYPCEVSEAGRRGVLGALPEAAFSLGFFLTYLLGGFFHWTTLAIIILFMFIPCIIALMFVPESPTWLLQHGKIQKAKDTLQKLRPVGHNVEKEAMEMQIGMSSDYKVQDSPFKCIQRLFKPNILLPVLTSTTLLVLKECTGQLVLALFVVQIFRSINVGIPPQYSSVIVASTRFLSNMICVFLLGHIPRKTMLIVASLSASISLALLGNYFYRYESQNMTAWTPLLYLTMFTIAFGGGIGPITYLMATELLPNSVRGVGSGVAGTATFTAQFCITFMAAGTTTSNIYKCMWGYSVGCLVLAGFVILLPETKGLSLQKLEDYWNDQTCRLNSSCCEPQESFQEKNDIKLITEDTLDVRNSLMKQNSSKELNNHKDIIMVDYGDGKLTMNIV